MGGRSVACAASVLHLAGRASEARAAAARSLDVYRAKGFVNGVRWAEASLAAASGTSGSRDEQRPNA